MTPDKILRWIVISGVIAGFALHAYTCVFGLGPTPFTLGLFAFSILPYLACLAAIRKNVRWQCMAACMVIPILLVLDILAYREVFIAPTSSTSALALLEVPIVNIIVLLVGFVIGWIISTLSGRGMKGNAR